MIQYHYILQEIITLYSSIIKLEMIAFATEINISTLYYIHICQNFESIFRY